MNNVIGLVLSGVAALAVMFSINASITLVALTPFFVVAAVSCLATTKIQKFRVASRKTSGEVTGFIGELFGAVQAVKVASAEEKIITRFQEINEFRRKAALKDEVV